MLNNWVCLSAEPEEGLSLCVYVCVCVWKVCKCEVRVEWLLTDALGVSVYVAKCLKHVTALKCLYICVRVFVTILFMLSIARFR